MAFIGPLLLDISLDCLQCYIPDGADIVSPIPEVRFPLGLGNADGKLVTHSFGTGGRQIIDHGREVNRRADLYQKIDMIIFVPEFEQLAPPAGKYPGG